MILAFLILVAILALVVTIIAVNQYKGEKYLCDNCQFNSPEKCQKKERPKAVECYAYLREEKSTK